MDANENLTREQLELAIQKKKITEVYGWFHEHFVSASREEYKSKCPFLIFQGPTGSGKTSVLRWISSELKVPIREYSETFDTTAIKFDIQQSAYNNSINLDKHSFERRNANKFEHFVINSAIYNPLYPSNNSLPQDDDEFDSDDDFISPVMAAPIRPPPMSGVIIHVESSLTFAKHQRTLVQSIVKLIKVIKNLASQTTRRVAIVFETLDCDGETMSIPNKLKASVGMQTFKFNPITKANMKKLIEAKMKSQNIVVDKETAELIAVDCDGDMRACLNSLQILCNKSTSCSYIMPNGNSNGHRGITPFQLPVSKRQKLAHERSSRFELNPSLMRDTTRSVPFFHVLGKIFYQKRLYTMELGLRHRSIERPFPTENSTECLVDMVGVGGKRLITWLHQHYYKFCDNSNIERAATVMENLSLVDTISIESLKSSQFYELHNQLDTIQSHLAIESIVYSLYENVSAQSKASHKRIQTPDGPRIVKTSVEKVSSNGEMNSFNKPISHCLPKLVDDYKSLLDKCADQLVSNSSAQLDPTKLLVDYIPYLDHIAKNQVQTSAANFRGSQSKADFIRNPTLDRRNVTRIVETLSRWEDDPQVDYDVRHEQLSEMIDELEQEPKEVLS